MGYEHLSVGVRETLVEIARMAYGLHEGEAGGRGHLGVLNGPDGPRIIKFNTHRGTETGDASAIASSNALRAMLADIANGAGLDAAAIAAIRQKLGLASEPGQMAERSLLSRTVVADVVGMIGGRAVWNEVKATYTKAAYRSDDDTSFATVKANAERGVDSGNVKSLRAAPRGLRLGTRELGCLVTSETPRPHGAPANPRETRNVLLGCLHEYKPLEDWEYENRRNGADIDLHGRSHAVRTFIFGNVLGNILRERGVNVDVGAVAMMCAAHDAGRRDNGRDVYERESADIASGYFREAMENRDDASDAYADRIAEAITTNDANADTVEAYLLHSADSLDFWRVDELNPDYFPFLREDLVAPDESGNPRHVSLDGGIREELIRESLELTKLTHEKAALQRRLDALMNAPGDHEEEIAALQAQLGGDDLEARWRDRMNRTDEQVVDDIERAIREHPEKFPLLTKHYLNHVDPVPAAKTVLDPLAASGENPDVAGLRDWVTKTATQQADTVDNALLNGNADFGKVLEDLASKFAEELDAYVKTLSNSAVAKLYESMLGHNVDQLKHELALAGNKAAVGLLLDLEAVIASEVAHRLNDRDAPADADGMTVQGMAAVVDTASMASERAEKMERAYEKKFDDRFDVPVDIHEIGDKLRECELTINFHPEYLFGELKNGLPERFPIDEGDHVYKNIYKVNETVPDLDIPSLGMRKTVDDLHFPSIGAHNTSSAMRPTSAAINGVGRRGAADQYGNTVFVLKRHMKKHATYTYGASDFMSPLKITKERERAFVTALFEDADKLCRNVPANERQAFLAALDNPNSEVRRAIGAFFDRPTHPTRLYFFEQCGMLTGDECEPEIFADLEEGWAPLVNALGVGIRPDDPHLVDCLLRSCADVEAFATKQVDYNHLENLLGEMGNADEVRLNFAYGKYNGEKFSLAGADFIEAQVHKPVNVYEDVEEIRFSPRDLPDEKRKPDEYRKVKDALKAWGERHQVKVTFMTAEEEHEAVTEAYRVEVESDAAVAASH